MTRRRALLAALGFGLALLLPLVVQDYQLSVLFRIALYAALGLAWNLVGGYAGQLSLGHAAFFGIGAYGLPVFHRLGVPIVVAMLLGTVTAVLAAIVIGRVAFRLRGPYFALATIAFAEVLRLTSKNLDDFTGGDVGIQVPALFASDPTRWSYWCAVALTAAVFTTTAMILRSRFGYALQAVREDEDTTLACGIDPARTKLTAFAISAAFTALGGALYASLFFYIVPDQVFSLPEVSEKAAVVAMLGGAGTLSGPIVGAIVLETAQELFKTQFHEAYQLIYGVLLVVVVLFLPEGIVGSVAGWLRRKRAS